MYFFSEIYLTAFRKCSNVIVSINPICNDSSNITRGSAFD